ncbi:(-)-germacrene D synthase [Glycine soja]|uniref:(-)-germacrene D synthase n=2 Tax=Glycine soja TaxID=3848 RepID=A0A445HQ56_GLYSO|nr:(-)-germacrene D synthase [Glycine soja]
MYVVFVLMMSMLTSNKNMRTRHVQLLEFATVTPHFIPPDCEIYKGSKLSRVYCLLDQESCVALIELKKIIMVRSFLVVVDVFNSLLLCQQYFAVRGGVYINAFDVCYQGKLDSTVNSSTFGRVDEEGFTIGVLKYDDVFVLHVTNDVTQSYAKAMPSPDPRIEPLSVQSGFSNVAELGQVKISGALVAALVERWSGRGLRFYGISRGDVIGYKSRFDNMHNEKEEPTVVLDEQVEPQEHSREDDSHIKQAQLIKEEVRTMLIAPIDNNFYFKLEFIDSVQRLGVSSHFEHEIDGALHQIYNISTKDNNIITHDDDLPHVALLFRLLRQQGYHISSNVFYKFKDQTTNFSEKAANDIQGMLSLYEAAELRMHGEDILEEAHNFALVQLTKSLTTQLSPSMIAQVKHSLRRSLRKGLPRLEATYYMSFYEEDPSHDENLLTFAKLDFNMLQELHQKEVNNVTRWWIKNLNVSTKLPFVRDRIVECYFWILGIYFEPQYSLARRITTKVIALCSVIDDMYDAYGTIDELELFTNAIERWDICCLDDLPEYMKVCYMEILNVYEEIEEEMRKQGKVYCIKYAKKEMKRLIKAHMAEARWLHCNHTPTIEEYMQVRIVSSGYSMVITICFVGMKDTTEEVLIWATSDPIIIGAASIISRLMDDIVGNEFEQERRHIASSIECYMKQHNTSRQDAINKLLEMVKSSWKDINEACLNPTEVPMNFLLRVVNLVRMMDVLYKDEDNYTNAGGLMKDYIKTLLVNKMSARIS